MPELNITVTVRTASTPGSVKAHADVRVEFPSSNIELFGLSIVHHDPKKLAWVAYPQRAGKNGKKYFPIVRVGGALHEKICAAVLSEYERLLEGNGREGTSRAQAARQPGEDAIPL